MRKPWVRLYREEKGKFRMLPLFARALAKELLIIAGDDGVIELGGLLAEDAIARQLGADTSDRRLLRKYVPMLLEEGYLVHRGDVLIIRKLVERQMDRAPKAPDATSSRARTGNELSTSGERVEHEHSASGERVVNESATNHERTENEKPPNILESLNTVPRAIREEKSRSEERRGDGAGPPPQPRKVRRRDPLDYHRAHPVYAAALTAMDQARQAAGWGPLTDSALSNQTALGLACCAAEDLAMAKGLQPAEVLATAARGFVATRKPGARLEWWAENFGDFWQAGSSAPTTEEDRLRAEQVRLVELAAVADPDEQARLHAKIRDIAAERRRLKGAA